MPLTEGAVTDADAQINLAERIRQLLAHHGAAKAHFAGGGVDVIDAARNLAASLTLVNPVNLAQAQVKSLTVPLALISAEKGPFAAHSLPALDPADITYHTVLHGYEGLTWSDTVHDRCDEVGDSMVDFLAMAGRNAPLEDIEPAEASGAVAEIGFRACGAGEPLVLFPTGLAGNQWQPLIERLAATYCVIVVGGKHIPPVSTLEFRAATAGYRAMLRTLMDGIDLSPDQRLLEVGCGTGAVARRLATESGPHIRITAVDVNRFLLDQATSLRDQAGLQDSITFHEGDAHALPFADDAFDATISVTMLEEVDADQVLAELVRVTRPGGRVGVVVRAIDMQGIVSADIEPDLSAKIGRIAPGEASPRGCADASLYQRFRSAGLTDLKKWPVYSPDGHLQDPVRQRISARLSETELAALDAAAERAGDAYFIAIPMHVAVGTKP
jgi:SAM-dependent methyltransferase